MPFSTSGEDQALTGLNGGTISSIIAYASLHSAYSATGSDEITYASGGRVALTWSASSGGSMSLASEPAAFNVPGSTTVEYVGFFSASTSGTFAGMGPVGAGTIFAVTATDAAPCVFTAPGSPNYSSGQGVVAFGGAGGAIPTGFTAGAVYYVAGTPSPTATTFSLAATLGGTAVASSSAGTGLVQTIAPETFGSTGTLQLTTGTTLYLY